MMKSSKRENIYREKMYYYVMQNCRQVKMLLTCLQRKGTLNEQGKKRKKTSFNCKRKIQTICNFSKIKMRKKLKFLMITRLTINHFFFLFLINTQLPPTHKLYRRYLSIKHMRR